MTSDERTLEVGLGARSYPIHIGRGTVARAGSIVAGEGARRAVVVTNETVASHWLAPLHASLHASGVASDLITIADGEAHKNLATLESVLTRLIELRAERSTTLVALGGGVVGDLAGFAAAIYQRGMRFLQVPTTLLAQVDSSVGGKTAVNHALGKNLIGAFNQPDAVVIDTDCLRTLPARELAAGLAEVIKYGAICDASFFAWLEANMDRLLTRDPDALTHAIAESCRIKAAIVARDEREHGERALLNYGHTFGHAIEAGLGYGKWLHGEAVAAGMLMAAELSVRRGELAPVDRDRLRALTVRAGLPVTAPALGKARFRELMGRDKKVSGGAVRFVLLGALGSAYVTSEVADADLDAVLP